MKWHDKGILPSLLRTIPILCLSTLLSCGGDNGIVRQEDPALARFERGMFDAVNRYRDSAGLGTMAWNETVASIARKHSKDMAEGKFGLGHTGANQRTIKVGETIPWKSISENVAYSTERADIINFLLDRWLASSGHRVNIEGHYDLTGVGVAESEDGKIFFTQIFVLKE